MGFKGDKVRHHNFGDGIAMHDYVEGEGFHGSQVKVDFGGTIRTVISSGLYNPAQKQRQVKIDQIKAEQKRKNAPQKALEAEQKAAEFVKQSNEKIQKEAERRIQAIQDKERYKNELIKQLEKQAVIKEQKIAALKAYFESDYLNATHFYETSCKQYVIADVFDNLRIQFIKNWLSQNLPKSDGKTINLDDEQALAVATVNGNVQVLARAGSGKTTTLVIRAFFLIKHCKIIPTEILLLAFNKKAAQEVRKKLLLLLHPMSENYLQERLEQEQSKNKLKTRAEIETQIIQSIIQEDDILLPHVFTFHALAYAIVHPEEAPLHNTENNLVLSQFVQNIIDGYLRDENHQPAIQQLMMDHFRADWIKIIEGGYEKDSEKFLVYRRSLPLLSLRGEYVKSYGEKLIADFLLEHNIDYKYEKNHPWNGINYRPDFTLPTSSRRGIIIEYFGLEGDSTYDQSSREKEQFWRNNKNWSLISYTPKDFVKLSHQEFVNILKTDLEALGLTCTKLSEEEIWQRCKDRAIDSFTKAMGSFIGRSRQLSYSHDDLIKKYLNYPNHADVETQFLDLAIQLYGDYLNSLENTGDDDFNGLIQTATTMLLNDKNTFETKDRTGNIAHLKHVFIDEYQDFSHLFNELIQAIKTIATNTDFFCVGDDWQAINGFAGSDLKYFSKIEKYLKTPTKLHITTNYRSPTPIVDMGNNLMRNRGVPAQANVKVDCVLSLVDINKFTPSPIEQDLHSGDLLTPVVLRIIKQSLIKGHDVVLLCRKNNINSYIHYAASKVNLGYEQKLERYLMFIRSFFVEEQRKKITISTAHKYKGLEKPTVIVLELTKQNYPLVHPDWVFNRIFGDSLTQIIDEERRLLYVALTRAENNLYIITDTKKPSPFLEDIQSSNFIRPIEWRHYPPGNLDGQATRVMIHIQNNGSVETGGTFPIKDLLKACGYKWQPITRSWTKSVALDTDGANQFKSEPWLRQASNIIIKFVDERGVEKRVFVIPERRQTTNQA
jgi:DNA helicase-4